jgi:UDP-N-acetylmuramate dehydrogenase
MMKPRRNQSLGALTTFGVAGIATQVWTLEALEQVDACLDAMSAFGSVPGSGSGTAFVLGGGSNVLFARDLQEPLVLVRLRGRRLLDEGRDRVLLEVGAGEGWDETVQFTLSRGWFGLENLSLIPGLVGGAPWQNIGAYGVEVGEFIDAVEAVHLGDGRRRSFSAADCAFGYRSSFFKTPPGREWLITSVRLRLFRQGHLRTGHAEVAQELAARASQAPSPALPPSPLEVAAAVRALRRRKLPDPAVVGNAGSFFKNPIVSREEAEALRLAHPKAPLYPLTDDPTRAKLSAGWLIEAAGWKGFREGDAGVSSRHALVLVNHGNATGRQLLALARRIQQSVFERFGVSLEPEPVIVQ